GIFGERRRGAGPSFSHLCSENILGRIFKEGGKPSLKEGVRGAAAPRARSPEAPASAGTEGETGPSAEPAQTAFSDDAVQPLVEAVDRHLGHFLPVIGEAKRGEGAPGAK